MHYNESSMTKNYRSVMTNEDNIRLVCGTSATTSDYNNYSLTMVEYHLFVHLCIYNDVKLPKWTGLTTMKLHHSRPIRIHEDNKLA